jgi:1,4-dihydroxy-2-naphthoate octaprenyltransferase
MEERRVHSGWRAAVADRLRALRAFSLPMSVLPVVLATAAVLPADRWRWEVLILSAVAVAGLHLAGNLLNDYFDFRRGVDRRVEGDAGRPGRLLVRGRMSAGSYLRLAAVCLAVAAGAAGVLAWRRGPVLLAFGAAAVAMLYSYTGPPLRLKYRALGEVVIFVTFGPLLMVGAAYAQTLDLEPAALLLSVPVGFATAAVLVGNNLRDEAEDAEAGIRTIVHVVGRRAARAVYVALVCLFVLALAAMALARRAPWALLAAPLALAMLHRPLTSIRRNERLADIDARTAAFETVVLLLAAAAYVMEGPQA